MKPLIVVALLYGITGSRARSPNSNGKIFDDNSYHQSRMGYFEGNRNLAKSVPSLSPVSTLSIRPTKDNSLSSNKKASSTSSSATPPKNQTQQNNAFSLEEITQSGVKATYNQSSHFSHLPSDIPSFVPSQSSSDELSSIPSDVPSLTPSDAPSLTPAQEYDSNASRRPSDPPSSQPFNEIIASSAPVSVPVHILIPNTIPSETYDESSSSVPTLIKNNMPTAKRSAAPISAIEFPSARPSEVISRSRSSRPSYRPSQTVASRPSKRPTEKNPTGAPSVFIQAESPNQDELIHSTVQLLELTTSKDTELSEDDVKIFQSICESGFLATYLPKTHEADYNTLDCVLLSQSIDKQSQWRDRNDPGGFLLSILLQVRSEVQLPDSVAFSHIVSLTFQNYSEELQVLLGSMAYFPSVHTSDKGPIITEIQGGDNSQSKNSGITATVLVGALLGGAVLAFIVSGLIIYRSRNSWGVRTGNTRPGEGTRQSLFSSSSTRSVPRVIGFTTDGSALEKGRGVGPKSVESENSCNMEDIARNLNMECHSRTNSAERTEGSGSLDSSLHGLDLLQSSMSSGESKLDGKKTARMKIGRRRKSEDNSHKPKETQMLNSLGSDDVSTDLECGADSINKTHTQSKMDDCQKVAPSDDRVQSSEIPEDESFLQMHLDDLAHTGEVLNDLGQFEEQWHDRLTRVRVSASAETPRQANTQYRRPPRSRSMIFSSMSNDVLSEFTDAESL